MINVEKDALISFGINRRMVKLVTSDNKVIFREIIYPIGEHVEDIKNYLHTSLPKIESFELLKSEIGICFIDKDSRETIMDNKNPIDNYWIDGETFLVDYQYDNQNNYLFVVIDSNLDKDLVINSLKGNVISEDVLFVDQLSDCWIKRNEN